MTGRNKQFTIAIQEAARRIVTESGTGVTQRFTILPLAKLLMTETGCGIDAAKRHIRRAIRGERLPQRGGSRPGSGWPKGVPRGPRTTPHSGGWPKGVKRAGQRGKKVEQQRVQAHHLDSLLHTVS